MHSNACTLANFSVVEVHLLVGKEGLTLWPTKDKIIVSLRSKILYISPTQNYASVDYTAKNGTETLHGANFIKLRKIRIVVIWYLQTCYNLFKQLAASLWITSFDNQLATSLLTTCNLSSTRVNDVSLLIISLLQDVNILFTPCAFFDVYPLLIHIPYWPKDLEQHS